MGKCLKFKITLCCNSVNVVHRIICQGCGLQYTGSAVTFKETFRIHKSDNNVTPVRAKLITLKPLSKESVNVLGKLLEENVWHREKYWQA